MSKTLEIDTVTHQLVNRHITEQLLTALSDGVETVYLVATKERMQVLPTNIRVELSRMYRVNGVRKCDRLGLRISEPFKWDLNRGVDLTCLAVTVQVYHSPLKTMAKAMSSSESFSLQGA